MSAYASIYLLDAPYCIDNTFDYYIPPNLRCDILCGDFVTVPFGTANKTKIGLVTALSDKSPNSALDYKSVIEKFDLSWSLSAEALGLCFFLKEQTLCTMGDAVRAVMPTAAFSKMETVYSVLPCDTSVFEPEQRVIYEYISQRAGVSHTYLKSRFGDSLDKHIKKLEKLGALKKDFEIKQPAEKLTTLYSLNVSKERAMLIAEGNDSVKLRSQKHAEILKYLALYGPEAERAQITDFCGVTGGQLKALCEKQLISCRTQVCDRSIIPDTYQKNIAPIVLNEEQQAAHSALCSLCDSGEAHGVLLHGVTGSGKTSVMMRTIDHVLECGRSVIVLLPEIALTPQTLSIFCSRYGDRVAIIHSALSTGERIDTYKRIKNGGADVVIGTRSAVFAPISDLGLIIIDEEQEHTYKSDMNPKYHTRDVARYRAAHHKAVMLLASATPSFESYKKAIDGKYTLIELKSRYGGATLPEAVIVDMRPEMQSGNTSPIGKLLAERLLENTENKNQSILFINRRGYNTYWGCRDCGQALKCPSCSVSLTYHTTNSQYTSGYLACHWCGKRFPLPSVCPECGSEHITRMGYGTQRVEQELSSLIPNSRVLRMDTDTTNEKSAYESLLGKFRRHEADILLGTQMVTKGHDFPDVTLVGVLLADSSLYLDDYRAAERTFSMLTQVIGRAGRSIKQGTAIIQTSNPDSECIKLACRQDYPAFYQSEIRLRKLLVFPPFCDIALLTLTSPIETELAKASAMLADEVKHLTANEFSDVPLVIYGPFEAPVYKVENKYRMRMVLKCKNNKRTRALLSHMLIHFSGLNAHKLTLSVDINPTNL